MPWTSERASILCGIRRSYDLVCQPGVEEMQMTPMKKVLQNDFSVEVSVDSVGSFSKNAILVQLLLSPRTEYVSLHFFCFECK